MYILFSCSSLATTPMSIYLKFKVHLLISARGTVILIGHNRSICHTVLYAPRNT